MPDTTLTTEHYKQNFITRDFSNQQINGVEFDCCHFTDCNFSDSELRNCKFIDCQFTHCNMSLMRLRYSSLSECVFTDCKMIGIDWSRAHWSQLISSGVLQFIRCNLTDGSFYGLSLRGIKLQACKLHRVDFREGNFSGSHFCDSDFSASLFGNSQLNKVDFSGASDYDIDMHQNQLSEAKFSRVEAVRLLYSLDIELVD